MQKDINKAFTHISYYGMHFCDSYFSNCGISVRMQIARIGCHNVVCLLLSYIVFGLIWCTVNDKVIFNDSVYSNFGSNLGCPILWHSILFDKVFIITDFRNRNDTVNNVHSGQRVYG